MIEFNEKQKQAILFYHDKFEKEYPQRDEIQKERQERKDIILNLTSSPEKIDSLSKSEIDKLESSLWSYLGDRFKRRITDDNDISKIKKTLKYLIFGNDHVFDRALKVDTDPDYKLRYFGESKISELLVKSSPSLDISLVNKRSKNLAHRMGFNFENKKFSEKLELYDEFIKKVQSITRLKSLDDVDFLLFFIDSEDFIDDPFPKQKTEVEFAFVDDDFKRTTGKQDDAKYLSKRIREFGKSLKNNLTSDFSEWESKASGALDGSRRFEKGGPHYQKMAWIGFSSPNAIDKRVQESIQIQTSLHKDGVNQLW